MLKDLFGAYKEAFRVWVRSKMRPLTIEQAEEKKLFWSKCYMISCVSAAVLFLFYVYKYDINFNYDKNLPRPLAIAKLSDSESVRILKYSGLKQVSDTRITMEELKKLNEANETGTPESENSRRSRSSAD